MSNLSDDEKEKLFEVIKDIRDGQQKQGLVLTQQSDQLKRLEFGMFGDKQMGMPGLVEKQQDTTNAIELINRWILNQKLRIAWISGAIAVIGILVDKGWDWLVGKH